ncbi:MAG: hypothetical protein FWE28_07540 [Oscillospiraceae bacterium]|nr:hypothetical protein [Oscillospiraceae bacterium]
MTNHHAHLGDASFLRLEIDRTAARSAALQALATRCDDIEVQRACTQLGRESVRQVRRLQLLLFRKSGYWHRVPEMCPYVPTCHGTLWLMCLEAQAGAVRLGAYTEAAHCPRVQRLCRTLTAERAKAARTLEALL